MLASSRIDGFEIVLNFAVRHFSAPSREEEIF